MRGGTLSQTKKNSIRDLGGAELVLDALERLDHRARDLREVSNDILVHITEVRGLVQLLAAKGRVTELDREVAEVRDIREVLMATLDRGLREAEKSLSMAQGKMLAIEVSTDIRDEGKGSELVETARLPRSSPDYIPLEPERARLPSRPPPDEEKAPLPSRPPPDPEKAPLPSRPPPPPPSPSPPERPRSASRPPPDAEKAPLPSRPPPDPEKAPLPSRPPPPPPSESSDRPSEPPSDLPGVVAGPGEDLASLIERHSWNADLESPNDAPPVVIDEKQGRGERGPKRPKKPRSRSAIPAARAKKPPKKAAKGAGDWEEDLSSLLERGTWAANESETEGSIDGEKSPRRVQQHRPKDTVENLLSGYLKDVE